MSDQRIISGINVRNKGKDRLCDINKDVDTPAPSGVEIPGPGGVETPGPGGVLIPGPARPELVKLYRNRKLPKILMEPQRLPVASPIFHRALKIVK
jgi:hypothetical protein